MKKTSKLVSVLGALLLFMSCIPVPAQTPTNVKMQSEISVTDGVAQQLPTPEATASGQVIYLKWSMEPTTSDFDVLIERSINQKEWEPVMLKQIMKAPVNLLYCWIDAEAPTGTVYYRLQRFEQRTWLYGTSGITQAAYTRPQTSAEGLQKAMCAPRSNPGAASSGK